MAAVYTAEEILEIVGGRLAAGNLEAEAGAISTDTRQIKEGDWFVALEGQKYDGHDFLGDAFAAGAIGAIVAERTGYAIGSHSFPLIAVDAPGKALACLARNWRRRISPQVLVVCGDDNDLSELLGLMRSAAMHQSFESVCLLKCTKASEAAEFVLNMPEESKLLIAGLCPSELSEVENAAISFEANVLSFLPLAFENLRLTSEHQDIKAAKISLVQNLNRMWAWVLSVSSGEIEELAGTDTKATLLTCPQKFFENLRWQNRHISYGESLVMDYERAVQLLSNRFDSQLAWLAVSASALAGLSPANWLDGPGLG